MKNTFSILFYPKRSANEKRMASLYLRITVEGERSEISLKRKVDIKNWNTRKGRLNGSSEEVRHFNKYIDDVKAELNRIYEKLMINKEYVSASRIKDIFTGNTRTEYMLLEVFENHNKEMESLIGKDYSKGTLQRYKAAKTHLTNYIKEILKKNDIAINLIDYKFISGLEYYLKFKKNCGHNNGWMDRDPFFHWKANWKTKDRQYLTEIELETLVNKKFKIERLEQVKDIFIFCCFTGLAYADVKKLNTVDIIRDISGNLWIKTERKKTSTLSSIPLLPTAKMILDKYNEHPYVVSGKGILPVLTNQKSNAYLKEIADLCGIDKNLTTHLARHTFATTVTLSNGVPIETVSKMLGHRSLKTTQHYAKVLDNKIANDMLELKKRIDNKAYVKKVNTKAS